MKICGVWLILFFGCRTVLCKDIPKPMTHMNACRQFSKTVVRIDTAGGRGTGFIVSSDGFILTAAHVVIDVNAGQYFRTISVTSPHGWTELAMPMLDIAEAAAHDFALLKISRTKLPFLTLGDESTLDLGEELTVIGFPFSALDEKGEQINARFCLSESVAAATTVEVGKSQVDIIYFQGVSVKGVSGSPLISDRTGNVVGILNTKLTGIGPVLQKLRDDIAGGKIGGGISMSGFGASSILPIINVLDLELANGLGSGTGAADAAYALKKAQRTKNKQP